MNAVAALRRKRGKREKMLGDPLWQSPTQSSRKTHTQLSTPLPALTELLAVPLECKLPFYLPVQLRQRVVVQARHLEQNLVLLRGLRALQARLRRAERAPEGRSVESRCVKRCSGSSFRARPLAKTRQHTFSGITLPAERRGGGRRKSPRSTCRRRLHGAGLGRASAPAPYRARAPA